ncbi:tRNA/rRNA methyltransferase yfiF [Klebsiella pneumoniae]|uniref:tRNA/rRNA methyltransferase yfiF n=1 Tax=Klebsiella pneumoniae TaxID=573 RepID=A0A377U030_KLEPN|nr:tRNA/rRNA methyltransferase yfiF [Klebsiella pneumoniae]
MSDELKNKSGKVKVMYVRSDDDLTNAPITHVPGKGRSSRKSRVDGRSRPCA